MKSDPPRRMTRLAAALALFSLLGSISSYAQEVIPRWRFAHPENEEWVEQHDRQLQAIDDWWKAFGSRIDDLNTLVESDTEWNLTEWMDLHLGAIDDRLMWEFGPGLETRSRLVITPVHVVALRPLVEVLLDRAPEFPDWEFYAYRLPEPATELPGYLRARGFRSLANTRVKLETGAHQTIDLTFLNSTFKGQKDDEAGYACFNACGFLLGEELLELRVRNIFIEKLEAGAEDEALVPLESLRSSILSLGETMDAGLSDRAWFDRPRTSLEFTTLEATPVEATDYPGQYDLRQGSTCMQDAWMSAATEHNFVSRRFSKHGETLCYLKLDGWKVPTEERNQARESLAELLDRSLREKKLGAVTGSGLGARYDYVEIAVVHLDRSLPQVQELARGAEVPERSWILFHDTCFAAEWIGVYSTTSSPPSWKQ